MRISLYIILLLISTNLKAIDLQSIPLSNLRGKNVIYFNGSFDPFHNGHQAMVESAKKHVDYIIVFAIDGDSPRKPNRISKVFRQEMLDSLYHDDPVVLTTSMDAYELQQYLRESMSTTFFVMFGTDVIDQFKGNEHYDFVFHRGTEIKPEQAKDSLSAMYVISADTFYIFARDDSGIPDKFLNDRDLIKLDDDIPPVSSTEIKDLIKKGKPFEHLVPEAVADVIKTHKLYRSAPK